MSINDSCVIRSRGPSRWARPLAALLATLLVTVATNAVAQTTYTWSGGASGVWATDVNWTPARTVPAGAPWTITASAGAGGSITPSGAVSVVDGTDQAFAIAADPCYSIADVLVDGASVGAVGAYTFTNVTANHTIAASFALNTYTITASAGSGGTISPSGAVGVGCGANQDFTIAPSAGYQIADVVVDGGSVGAVASYTFTNVQANHTIAASFTAVAAVIAAQSTATYICPSNSCVTLPVTLDRLNTTPVLGVSVTFQLSADLTLCAGTGSITEGTFLSSAGTTLFNVIDHGGGSYTADCAVSGTSCGPTATTGTLFSVGVTSANAGGTGSITVTSVALRDCLNQPLAATPGAPGTVPIDNQAPAVTVTSPNGGESFLIGTSQSITWTATDNTGVASVDLAYSTDGGATYPNAIASGVANSGSYAWTAPNTPSTQARVRVTAHDVACSTGADAGDADFTLRDPVVTASAGAGGTITPSGAVSVPSGTDRAFAIEPAACQHIADVLVDGASVGAVGAYTFTNVTVDHTIAASFALTTYTITATAGPGGTITPSGAVSVDCGSDQAFAIVANGGSSILDVVVDGGSVGPVGAYTFTNVQANHTIDATFSAVLYTLSVTIVGNGTVAKAPDQASYVSGTNVQLTATADPGWHFDSWTGDASGHTNPVTIVMDANKSVTAMFYTDVYSWNATTGTASFATQTSWTPTRYNVAADDVLQFNAGGSSTATGVTTQSIAQLLVSGNTTVALQSASAQTLTLTGAGGTDFGVEAGSRLDLNGTSAVTIAIGASATGEVGGTINAAAAAHKITAGAASGLTFLGGSQILLGTGFSGNVFGASGGVNNSVVFQGGSLYAQTAGANPFANTQPASIVVFQTGSRFRLDGQITPSFSGRSYADFEHNTAGPTQTTGGGALKIDNLIVTQGVFNCGMTGAFDLKGDITVNSGASLTFNPATGTPAVSLSGTAPQTITSNGSFAVHANETIEVKNASGVSLGSDITVRGGVRFTTGNLTTGSHTLAVTDSGSVSGAGAATGWVVGNLQRALVPAVGEASRTFDIGDAGAYTPVAIAAHGVPATFNLATHTSAGDHADIGTSGLDASRTVNRFYTLSTSGSPTFTSYDATFNFVAADVDLSANTGNFVVERWDGTAWHATGTGTRTATSTQATGVTAFSDFAIGELAAIATTTAVAADVNPSTCGQIVTFTASVTPSAATGSVTFNIDGVFVGGPIPLVAGSASLGVPFPTAGEHSIFAVYGGDALYLGSTSPTITQTVGPGASSVTLDTSPNPADAGSPVQLTAHVSPSGATGTVTFFDDATSIGSAPVDGSGQATLSISTLAAGTHPLTAHYDGDGCHTASTSSVVSQVVTPDNPPTTQVLAPNGGEVLSVGSDFDIDWTASDDHGVASVTIELTRDYGATWEIIAADIPNSGRYTWIVTPPWQNHSPDPVYSSLIRVTAKDNANQTGADDSDAPFAIFGDWTLSVHEIPRDFALSAVWPNPSPGSMNLAVALPQAASVRVSVVDLLGREVAVLADGPYPAGRMQLKWDGRTAHGSAPAGLYFVRYRSPGHVLQRRVVLAR